MEMLDWKYKMCTGRGRSDFECREPQEKMFSKKLFPYVFWSLVLAPGFTVLSWLMLHHKEMMNENSCPFWLLLILKWSKWIYFILLWMCGLCCVMGMVMLWRAAALLEISRNNEELSSKVKVFFFFYRRNFPTKCEVVTKTIKYISFLLFIHGVFWKIKER